MKFLKTLFIVAMLGCLFFSCLTTKRFTGPQELNFIFSLDLESDEVFIKDIPENVEATYNFSSFQIANMMLSLNSWFEFEKNISFEKQYALAQALFEDLPQIEGGGYLRVVALGKYFHEDTNLIVIIEKFKLKEGVIPGCEYGLMYLTNCFSYKSKDKETGEQKLIAYDSLISESVCYKRIYIPYPDGDLIAVNNLNLENKGIESAKDDTELVNLMDTYIKDGNDQNDVHIEEIYKNILEKNPDDPSITILAIMNYGLYQLKSGNYDEAKKLFDTAKTKLPEDADPSFSHAIDYEADFLLRMIQSLEKGKTTLLN